MYTSETPKFPSPNTHYQQSIYNSGPPAWMIILPAVIFSIFLIAMICACFSKGHSKDGSRSRGTGQELNTYNPGTTYHDWGIGQDNGGYSSYQSGHCSGGHYAGNHNSHSHCHHGGYSGHDFSSPSGFDGGCSSGGGGGGGDGGC